MNASGIEQNFVLHFILVAIAHKFDAEHFKCGWRRKDKWHRQRVQ